MTTHAPEDASDPPAEPRRDDRILHGVLLGICALILGTLLAIGAGALYEVTLNQGGSTAYRGVVPLILGLNFGFTQLAYMPFVIAYLVWKRRYQALKGLLIISAVAFLINATCYGILVAG